MGGRRKNQGKEQLWDKLELEVLGELMISKLCMCMHICISVYTYMYFITLSTEGTSEYMK